jgi:hypothetical protein
MSVILTNRGRHLGLSSGTWVQVLLLAVQHGWRAEGTYELNRLSTVDEGIPADERDLLPHPDAAATGEAFERAVVMAPSGERPETVRRWRSYDYSSNSGQVVVEGDAANLSAPLAQALDAFTSGTQVANARSGEPVATLGRPPEQVEPLDPRRPPSEAWLSPGVREVVREVIAFCGLGEFCVW